MPLSVNVRTYITIYFQLYSPWIKVDGKVSRWMEMKGGGGGGHGVSSLSLSFWESNCNSQGIFSFSFLSLNSSLDVINRSTIFSLFPYMSSSLCLSLNALVYTPLRT